MLPGMFFPVLLCECIWWCEPQGVIPFAKAKEEDFISFAKSFQKGLLPLFPVLSLGAGPALGSVLNWTPSSGHG